jgi:hypothetical protein
VCKLLLTWINLTCYGINVYYLRIFLMELLLVLPDVRNKYGRLNLTFMFEIPYHGRRSGGGPGVRTPTFY